MKHHVSFNVPTRDLGNSDVEFFVRGDDRMLGKLAVSKGSIVSFPKDLSYGHKASWTDFDTDMRKYARSEKRK